MATVVTGLGLLLGTGLGSPLLAQEAAQAPPPDPGWLSLLPPVLAIALALIFKDVIVALLIGVFSGALLLNELNPLVAAARSVDTFMLTPLTDSGRASILLFSALLGAMVGVISKSGGTEGIVGWLAPRATNARRGQVATWLLGVTIFFDDYANTLIVGPTMRPITDRLRISREKLAFIVDATAAPIVSLMPISTWVGFELGLVKAAFDGLELSRDAFTAIVASIPYRFYQFFILALGLTVALSLRDFGAMRRAEKRAIKTGKVIDDDQVPLADFATDELTPPADKPRRAINALAPVVTVVVVTLLGLFLTGAAEVERASSESSFLYLRDVFSAANSYRALLWASFSGVLVAAVLPLAQRILTVGEATSAAVAGVKATLVAFIVLILAWALGDVCGELHTADFLVKITEGELAPQLLPALVFVLSAAISFATGTAWGTMGILTPLSVPLAHSLTLAAGHQPGAGVYETVLLGTIAAVLSGSVWGDHCSPISDTTILSSMAAGCDHVAHVRTQAPYALVAGAIAVLVGILPASLGVSPFVMLALGIAVTVGVVWVLGRDRPEVAEAADRRS